MMTIKCFTFGPFGTNTYVVSDEQQVLLIDPACYTPYERQFLSQYIESVRKSAGVTIIATHGHLDHLWGAKWATEMWGVPVLMHEADIPMAKAMQQQYELFGIRAVAEPFPVEGLRTTALTEHRPQAMPADRAQTDNDIASVNQSVSERSERSVSATVRQCNGLSGAAGLTIIETPGHTPGSVCLYWPEEKVLISGDTLFCMGYGRTDLPGGNMGQLIGSLEELFRLPADTKVYPGHGDFTTIGAERR